MITLAGIRRAIYNLGKRLEILENNSGGGSGGSSGGSFSGDYNDLINKPTIPAAQIQSDWNQTDTTKKDYIKNKPNITNGLDGSDGKSAYELAVENGYSGTVQEWLASLHGLDGTNGTNGTNGLNGTNGITPYIDPTSKHWMIGETDTGIIAEGLDGTNGTNGITPHIDLTTGNWFIGETNTGVHALGPAGQGGSGVLSDWNEADNNSLAYIANKPTIPTVPSNENAASGGSTLSVVTTGDKYNWNNKANIWRGTQAQYDLLTPDDNTIYIIIPTSE